MQMISRSLKQTLKIGSHISKYLKSGDIICLFGEFGSGKTALTKGIAKGLGIKESDVISPSFVLLRRHCGRRFLLNHFDLYRLSGVQDILCLGYQEFLYSEAVSVIEWADRLGDFLPAECLKIELTVKSEKERLIRFFAKGARYKQLLKDITKSKVKIQKSKVRI